MRVIINRVERTINFRKDLFYSVAFRLPDFFSDALLFCRWIKRLRIVEDLDTRLPQCAKWCWRGTRQGTCGSNDDADAPTLDSINTSWIESYLNNDNHIKSCFGNNTAILTVFITIIIIQLDISKNN